MYMYMYVYVYVYISGIPRVPEAPPGSPDQEGLWRFTLNLTVSTSYEGGFARVWVPKAYISC